MDRDVPVKNDDETSPQQDASTRQDQRRVQSISPANQGLPCFLPICYSLYLMHLVSRPVAHFPSTRGRSILGPSAQTAPPYNRAEHNIFLKMQLADPLLAQGGQSSVATRPTVSQEESNERAKEAEGSDEKGGTGEEREASQLSSIAYDKFNEVKDTGGKS